MAEYTLQDKNDDFSSSVFSRDPEGENSVRNDPIPVQSDIVTPGELRKQFIDCNNEIRNHEYFKNHPNDPIFQNLRTIEDNFYSKPDLRLVMELGVLLEKANDKQTHERNYLNNVAAGGATLTLNGDFSNESITVEGNYTPGVSDYIFNDNSPENISVSSEFADNGPVIALGVLQPAATGQEAGENTDQPAEDKEKPVQEENKENKELSLEERRAEVAAIWKNAEDSGYINDKNFVEAWHLAQGQNFNQVTIDNLKWVEKKIKEKMDSDDSQPKDEQPEEKLSEEKQPEVEQPEEVKPEEVKPEQAEDGASNPQSNILPEGDRSDKTEAEIRFGKEEVEHALLFGYVKVRKGIRALKQGIQNFFDRSKNAQSSEMFNPEGNPKLFEAYKRLNHLSPKDLDKLIGALDRIEGKANNNENKPVESASVPKQRTFNFVDADEDETRKVKPNSTQMTFNFEDAAEKESKSETANPAGKNVAPVAHGNASKQNSEEDAEETKGSGEENNSSKTREISSKETLDGLTRSVYEFVRAWNKGQIQSGDVTGYLDANPKRLALYQNFYSLFLRISGGSGDPEK